MTRGLAFAVVMFVSFICGLGIGFGLGDQSTPETHVAVFDPGPTPTDIPCPKIGSRQIYGKVIACKDVDGVTKVIYDTMVRESSFDHITMEFIPNDTGYKAYWPPYTPADSSK